MVKYRKKINQTYQMKLLTMQEIALSIMEETRDVDPEITEDIILKEAVYISFGNRKAKKQATYRYVRQGIRRVNT